MAVISLMTDFGAQDEYVGVMKGVILAAAPEVRIVDLCHRIAPQDVAQGAFMIAAAFRYFPTQTLHVLVVDPGVGGKRRILYAEAENHRFLCPDNGLLTMVAQSTGLNRIRQVDNRALFAPRVSRTFHGRDVFAPVAAFLAQGGNPDQLGEKTAPEGIERLADWVPQIGADGRITGRIVAADRFGNLITNISGALLADLLRGTLQLRLQVDIGQQLTTHLHDAYEEVLPGAVLAIIGSRETLEIAINQGRACDRFEVGPGWPVTVQRG
ncbi:MAG: SAM-dependent chlorinase/fluorinase [Desulfobacterales bacterium]|nr:SAM-dependent chlorinase/fluorinase [Desulfobacterales bacterium]